MLVQQLAGVRSIRCAGADYMRKRVRTVPVQVARESSSTSPPVKSNFAQLFPNDDIQMY